MDFHSLARRELQCLCKKNKIPANITNLAMADALAALQHVEGLEELMKPSESDVLKSPARAGASIPVTGSRISARRKPIREVEVSQPLTQARVTRRTARKRGEENKDANVPKTPAITSSSKRAPVDSACRSLESQMDEDEEEGKSVGQVKSGVPKTPTAMASSRRRAPAAASASVQRACSTRRSVRFLEATIAELSLNEGEKSKTVEIIDLDEPTEEDNSEAVLDVLEVEKDSKESDMHTLEETDNTTISDKTEDKIEPSVCLIDNPEHDKKGADIVPGTEFSSEAKNQEETASVESNQLTPNTSYEQGGYSEEICENQVVDDEEIEYASEVKDDSGKVACESSSAGIEHSLGLPDGMEDSELESEHASDEEKIGDENPSVECEHIVALSNDKEGLDSESEHTSEERKGADGDGKVENQNSDEEVEVSPEYEGAESEFANEVKNNMVSDEVDLEMEGSDFENINGELFDVNVMEADVVGKGADGGDKVENQNSYEEVEVSPEDEVSKSECANEVKNNMVSDAVAVEMGGSDFENINGELFDVNVMEGDVVGKGADGGDKVENQNSYEEVEVSPEDEVSKSECANEVKNNMVSDAVAVEMGGSDFENINGELFDVNVMEGDVVGKGADGGDKVENQNSYEEVEVSPEDEVSKSECANEVKNNMVSDAVAVEMGGSDFENINGELFDVNVMEGDVVGKGADGGDKVENQNSYEEVEVSPEDEVSKSECANEVKNNMVSDAVAVEMGGSDFENISGELFDVNVMEADVVGKGADGGDKVENQNSYEEVEVSPEDEVSKSECANEVKNNMVSDTVAVEMGGSDFENISGELFDVKVIEADVVEKDKSPKCCTQAPEQTSSLVVVNVLEAPSSVKLSGNHTVTVTGATPLQPLADDLPLAAYQFPRPTQPTPMKSSLSKNVPLLILSDDMENKNSRKADCDDGMKTKVKEIADDLTKLDLNNLSIRELKKRLKEHTKNQNGAEKKSVVKVQQQGGRRMREPLQTLSDNQMAVGEQERN